MLKKYVKIIGYGLLLFIATMILLFVMSIVTGSEQPIDYPWVGAVVGLIIAIVAFWFSRQLKLESLKQKVAVGIIWAVMLAGILLIIAIPNETTKIVFGNWSNYFIFLGALIGPLFSKQKPKIPQIPSGQKQ